MDAKANLHVCCEPKILLDKYAVCAKTGNETIAGHLNKGETEHFAKTIFYFLRSHPDAKSTTKVTGKRCNLGDGEVSCSLHIMGQTKFISVLKHQLDAMKENIYLIQIVVNFPFTQKKVRVIQRKWSRGK